MLGVKVGDEFRYCAQMNAIGLHFPSEVAIGHEKHAGELLATSVVASGVYDDDLQHKRFIDLY